MTARYLHKVETGDGSQVNLIGHVFSWTINKDDFKRDDVIKAFEDNGLPSAVLREKRGKSAFIEAVRSAADKKIVHRVEETDDYLIFQFDEKFVEMQDDELKASFQTKAIIRYDKKADVVTCKNQEVLTLVKQLIGECKETYSKDVISKFIKAMFEKHINKRGLGKLIPLRRAGGSYFAGAEFSQYVFGCAKMLKQIDPESDFTILEIIDTPVSRQSVQESFNTEIEKEMEEIKEKMDELKTNGKDMSKTVYKNMIDEIQAASERIEMYQELLQYKAEAASEIVTKAKDEVKAYFLS